MCSQTFLIYGYVQSETDLFLVLLGRHPVYETENKAFRLFNFQLYPQRCCPVLQSSKFAVNVYTTVYYIFPIDSCSDITMFCFCFVLFLSLCCVSILIFFLYLFSSHSVYKNSLMSLYFDVYYYMYLHMEEINYE